MKTKAQMKGSAFNNLVALVIATIFIQGAYAQDSLEFRKGYYKVEVVTEAKKYKSGYLASLTDTSIIVSAIPVRFNGYRDSSGVTEGYHYSHIDRIKIRRSGMTRTGILLGGLTGAAIGAFIGVFNGDDKQRSSGGSFNIGFSEKLTVAKGALTFGVAGGIIGGLLGALAHKTITIKGKKDKFNEIKIHMIN